jgi:hypothetical protein
MAKQHKLTIADAHLQVIIAALAERPFRVAQPIIQSIDHQLRAAQLPETPPAAIEAPADQVATPNGHTTKAPLI